MRPAENSERFTTPIRRPRPRLDTSRTTANPDYSGAALSHGPTPGPHQESSTMEIKVGIQHVSREVTVETTQSAAEVEAALAAALNDNSLFALTDEKGRKVLIPAAQVAYVDLGLEQVRPVGFGSL